jgi:hypothetical protein
MNYFVAAVMVAVAEVEMNTELMPYYCILYVRSNVASPPKGALLPRRSRRFKIIDRDSPTQIRSATRLRAAGLSMRQPFRYYWTLSSQGRVIGSDVLPHIEWIFSNFSPSFRFAELEATGAEYGLSFYWGGGVGTGRGPEIVPELAVLLARYCVKLDFGIY